MRRAVPVRSHYRRTRHGKVPVRRHQRTINSRGRSQPYYRPQIRLRQRPAIKPIFRKEFEIGPIKTDFEINDNGIRAGAELSPVKCDLSAGKDGVKTEADLQLTKDKGIGVEKNLLTGTKKIKLVDGNKKIESPPFL